jgi:hypothetical protein
MMAVTRSHIARRGHYGALKMGQSVKGPRSLKLQPHRPGACVATGTLPYALATRTAPTGQQYAVGPWKPGRRSSLPQACRRTRRSGSSLGRRPSRGRPDPGRLGHGRHSPTKRLRHGRGRPRATDSRPIRRLQPSPRRFHGVRSRRPPPALVGSGSSTRSRTAPPEAASCRSGSDPARHQRW